MAHKVACYRKKCIKSANCFRDREELSSLYTISSHSASSIHSTDMTAETTRHNNYPSKTFIEEESYSGDCRNPTCTCNMRDGVHQNTCSYYRHRDYCNKRTPHTKNKLESVPVDTCEYVRQCCAKPCCPVHQYNKPKYCTNMKNLEECYWAKWKPSKFECAQRRRGCCECDCPKLRATRTQDKSVEVLREPGAFENVSSNENATVQPSTKDLYKKVLNEYNNQFSSDREISYEKIQEEPKRTYKKVLNEYNNQFSSDHEISYEKIQEEPKRTNTPHSEHSVRFVEEDRVHEFDPATAYNADLYNEIYEEYEGEFMRKIEEDEQREKAEYYQGLYNDMYNEYENELLSRMPSDQTETTETMPVETESTPEETENTIETDNMEEKTDSITVLHKPGGNQENKDDEAVEEEEPKPEVTTSDAKDLKVTRTQSSITNTKKQQDQVNVSQQKITKPTSFAAERLPVKGHTYPLKSMPKKQPQEKNKSKNGINRTGSPGSMNYLPAYLQRR